MAKTQFLLNIFKPKSFLIVQNIVGIPPANEVWCKVMFSVFLSVHRGVSVVQNFATRCPTDLEGGTCSSEFCHHQTSHWSGWGGVPSGSKSGVSSGATSGGGVPSSGVLNFWISWRGPEFWSSELLDFWGGGVLSSGVLNFWISCGGSEFRSSELMDFFGGRDGPDVTISRSQPPPPGGTPLAVTQEECLVPNWFWNKCIDYIFTLLNKIVKPRLQFLVSSKWHVFCELHALVLKKAWTLRKIHSCRPDSNIRWKSFIEVNEFLKDKQIKTLFVALVLSIPFCL